MPEDELTRRLEDLGRAATPPVDGAFANRLEAELRAADLEAAAGGSARVGTVWPGQLLRPGVVVAALVMIAGLALLLRSGDEPSTIQIAAAEDTTVSIPGATALDQGIEGLELPDGTRITVGDGGSAIVAGIVLEAGTTAIVNDGRIEVIDSPAVTTLAAGASTTTVDGVATTTIAPGSRPSPTVTTDPSVAPSTTADRPATTDEPPVTTIPPPTTDDTGPTTDGPTTTRRDVRTTTTSTTTAPAPTTTKPPATTTTTTDARPTVAPDRPQVRLEVGPVRERRATLVWEVKGDTSAIARWQVRIVRGDEARTIAVIRVAEARRIRVEVPADDVGFRVVAMSADGRVVAASAIVPVTG